MVVIHEFAFIEQVYILNILEVHKVDIYGTLQQLPIQ